MKKHLLLLILLILPICVYASAPLDYNNSIGQAEAYINKGNYTITHERYIKQTSFSHFISKEEYDATKGEKGKSYLFDGTEYWTSTGNSSTHFIVNYSGNTVEVGNNDKYNTRDVEYINDDVAIIGRGTYANPWTFSPMYEIKFVTDTRYGYIKEGSAELASKTLFVTRNDDATITMSAKTGFSYITNNCGATFSNGELKLEKVKRNTTCTVVFGTGKYKVTLAGATPDTIYVKYNDNFYRNDGYKETISKVTPPNRTGYTFKGYYFEGTKVIDENGNVQRASASKIYKNIDLTPKYVLTNPSTPTISGASTKIYNSSDTTLTCATSTTYASGAKKYYEFGYSTVDGGTPTTWSSPSESATYTITKNTYIGDRYYSCRVQVKDSTYNIESSVVSSSTASDALVRYNNATVTFNGNNGTVSGTSPLYTRYGQTKFFTGIRNTTTATTPKATRTGYIFNGWYSAASGGTQYYDGSGTNKKAFDKSTDVTMYAQWNAAPLTFNNQTLNAGTYGTAYTSNAFTGATNGTGSYKYTIKSGAPTGAKIDSTNRKISFTASTTPKTYSVVVHVKDNNSGSEKDATMTIVINKAASTAPTLTAKTYTYDGENHCVGVSGGTSGLDKEYAYCKWNGSSCGNWSSWSTSSNYYCDKVPGQWKIKARSVGNDYYNTSSDSSEVILTINKAASTAPKITAYEGTYDGNNHCAKVTGGTSGLTTEYSYCGGQNCTDWTDWSTNKKDLCATSVAYWRVRTRVKGNAYYNDSSAANSYVWIKPTKADICAQFDDLAGGTCNQYTNNWKKSDAPAIRSGSCFLADGYWHDGSFYYFPAYCATDLCTKYGFVKGETKMIDIKNKFNCSDWGYCNWCTCPGYLGNY